MCEQQKITIELMGINVTLSDITVADAENGEGIISCNYESEQEFDDELMRVEIQNFITSVLEDAVKWWKEKEQND